MDRALTDGGCDRSRALARRRQGLRRRRATASVGPSHGAPRPSQVVGDSRTVHCYVVMDLVETIILGVGRLSFAQPLVMSEILASVSDVC